MKLYLDTANIWEIKNFYDMGIIDGVTTNPSLIIKQKISFPKIIKEISSILPHPVITETVSTDAQDIVNEAKTLSNIASNVIVGIPVIPEGLKAIKMLKKEHIKINATLIYSTGQAVLAAKAGALYITPTISTHNKNWDDSLQIMKDLIQIFNTYGFRVNLMAKNVSSPEQLIDIMKIGVPFASVSFSILNKMLNHTMTHVGLRRYIEDWWDIMNIQEATLPKDQSHNT